MDSFRGVSLEQDSRFSDKNSKFMKSLKFPPHLDRKVNISKVNMNLMTPWIENRINEIIGMDDEVLVNFVIGLLEDPKTDPRVLETNIIGFFEKDAHTFVLELWELLISAEENGGNPKKFVEEAKEHVKMKIEETKKYQDKIRSAINRDNQSQKTRWDEAETKPEEDSERVKVSKHEGERRRTPERRRSNRSRSPDRNYRKGRYDDDRRHRGSNYRDDRSNRDRNSRHDRDRDSRRDYRYKDDRRGDRKHRRSDDRHRDGSYSPRRHRHDNPYRAHHRRDVSRSPERLRRDYSPTRPKRRNEDRKESRKSAYRSKSPTHRAPSSSPSKSPNSKSVSVTSPSSPTKA